MISLGFASYSLTLLCHSWTLWGFWCKRTLRQSIKRENTQSDNHKENTSIRTIYSHTFVCFTIPSKCHMWEGLKKSYSSKWWENKFHVLHREVLLVLIANQAFYQLILPKSNTLKAKLWEKKCIWCSKKRKTNELWMIITEKLSKISIKKILFNHHGENFQTKLTSSLKNACLCTLKVTFITYLLSNSGLLSIKCSNLAILSSKSMSSDYEDKEAMII